MATIIKKSDKMSGAGRLTGKFIVRPVVVVQPRVYNGPSAEGAREYNSLKREFNSLFIGFGSKSLKQLDAFDRVLKQADYIRAGARRVLVNKIATPGKSWAEVVLKGPHNEKPIVRLVSKTPSQPWSRNHARRDYTQAFLRMTKERAAARLIVEGMAARRPRKVFPKQQEHVKLVDRVALKAALQLFRRERKQMSRPKEVDSFDFRCYQEVDKAEKQVPRIQEPCYFTWGIKSTSVKQIKKQSSRLEHDQRCEETRFEFKPNRSERRSILISQLSRTALGQYIVAVLLKREADKTGSSVGDAVDKLKVAFESKVEEPKPQMDPEGAIGQTANSESKLSNTVIDSLNPVDKGLTLGSMNGFRDLSISKESQIFSTMVDRWILLGDMEWSSETSHGAYLKFPFANNQTSLNIPGDIIKNNKNSPNAQLFLTHRWARYDVRLRFALNSNPFQVGSCVPSVIYKSSGEYSKAWENIYSALQRNHCKLNAGTSNDAELVIPYRHVNSMTCLKNWENIAQVSVAVLNKLITAGNTAKQCSITVYATFENVEFSGLISRSLGEENVTPQMDSIANVMNAGSDLIRTIRGDANRDNPPLSIQPVSLIPQAMPSFAYTDGVVDPVNMLRADSRGQTPHADMRDEMDPHEIARKWGYVKTVDWLVTDPYGKELYSVGVCPLLEQKEYETSVTVDNLESKVYPPIAFITSLYGKWRGDLEYKFEIFGSKFHTGRLIIGSVPFPEDKVVGISDLKYSAYKIFDLADSTEFIFRAPWHWRNSNVSTYSAGKPIQPSKLFVMVVNKLIAIENVAPQVYINIYVRAAENFELFIPRPSVLAPRFSDVIVPPSTEYLHPYNFEDKVWTDWRGVLKMANGNYAMTINIDSVANGWAGFLDAKEGEYYELAPKTTKDKYIRIPYYADENGTLRYVKWAAYDPSLSTANAHGLVLCTSEVTAQKFAVAVIAKMDLTIARQNCCFVWYKQGPVSQVSSDGKNWNDAINVTGDTPVWIIHKRDVKVQDGFELIEPQNDPVPVTSLERPTILSNGGLTIYGERTPDLKSLCRRYTHFGTIQALACIKGNPRDCPYAAKLNVSPMRHVNPETSFSYDNRWRNGTVTTIGSMYRLWRGSLRFRFVVVGSPPEGTTLYVQHRFDLTGSVRKAIEPGPKKVRTRDDLMNTQYATFAQALDVNSTCTVEVPYYSEKEGLSIIPKAPADWTQNGVLLIWVHSKVEANVHLEVFYSFADDCRFSVFQGCPAAIDINTIAPEPQMETESVEANGLFESVKRAVSAPTKAVETIESVKETSESLTRTSNKLSRILDSLSESKDKIFKKKKTIKQMAAEKVLSYIGDEIIDTGSKFFEVATHLIYAVLSPTKKVIAWAIFNIYKKLFGMTFDGVHLLTRHISDLYEKMKYSTQRPQREEVEAQGDGTVSSYASLLFTSIATLCRLKASPPTSWKGIADGLFSFSNAARSGSFVSQFVQDNLEFFRRVYEKFLGLFGVKSSNYKLIAGLEDERLKNWLTSSDIILSAQYEEKLITDPSWSQKAFELGVIGRALERTLSLDPITPTRLLQLVRANVAGLKKIEKKLISRKVFSGARYTPSCIWVAGPAGTGKTHLLQDLAVELARFHQYRGVQTYHTMSAGVKYFDAYIGQPMIIIDDFLSGEITGSSEIGTQFLQMKSCNVFNMPKAAVEDKDQLLNFSDLGITSNYPFVDGLPGIHDRDAYNRRRDIVLHFEFNDPTLTPDNLKQRYPTDEPLIRMEHLNVYYYEEPTNTHSAKIQIQPENGDLGATVRAWCMERLRAYHTREAEGYARRCRNIQQALEEVGGEGSFEEVYRRYESSIKKFKEMILLNPNSLFRDWIRDAKDASTSSNLPAPAEAQAPESPFGWPYDRDERCGPLSSKTVIEPFDRENLPPIEPKLLEERCLHEIFDFKYANYDKDLNIFYSDRQSFPDSDRVNNLAMSVPGSCCKRSVGIDDVEDVPYCAWNDKVKRNKFLRCYIYSPMVKDDIMKKIDVARHARDWSILDEECPSVVAYLKDVFGGPSKAEPNSKVISMIAKEQIRLATEHQIIGEVVVPKKPKWKTFLANVWSVLLNVLVTIQSIIAILVGGIFLFSIFQFMTSPAPAIADPNMHPSGDFKTIRSAKTVKARSIRLLDGQGNEVSGSEEDILSSVSQKKNNSGIYRKIVNNSFFLVGKVPIPDTNKFLLYKSRCLGLYNKKFICLEHYIKYFKSVGVERVVVIYHEGKGMIEYDLKDIKFTWTSEGYGVGELPKSAPRQFSDITKYMPSERFDMAYPRRLKIFEIWNESVVEHLVEASLLSKPIVVNGTSAEGSWTISQGFQYAWGGKGCCGSVVIAEDMACPLVGIHTAGVGDKKGFAELLFRETFEDEAEVVLEYVTPNMDRTDSIYGLEGSYYEVGQLSADMAVRGSDKTRIEPSEIQGVFPVMTEPAPLTSKDPRLEGPKDILKIGASKRCDPPKEFPPEFTRTAFLSYWNLIKTEVKPIRAETGVLSMTQAIEGFLLPGYDPIVMSTSEGYPWVNMRPKGYSDKSWMFQRDSYPDGRMKILGVDPDLKTIFDLKESMRSRGVVPSSYFTCCLKDARILKEKVSIPGKTRVFEACPIDLTIAYRQYNLDFTAAFSAARLRAENSIGINPDGPEWTELANWLLDFSPYIITADYSAFGPRLNHTVLENAFNITTEWYALHEECDEDEKDRRYLIREVLREEIVHALTIAKDLVFIPTCGMPSGFPDTVTKNSESNSQYIRIAFLALARKHQPCYSDLWWFTKLVRLVTNGDDLIAAIKPEIISWFNNETIIEFFAQYDIKMTDALKNGIVRPYCSLEEATYLKRGFLKHPTREGQWLAPLEQTSITDAANWIWRSVDRRGASLTNSEMSCRLAYSSGPKLYNQVCTTIAKRWAQEGVNFVYPPWILLDNHVWDNAPGPLFSF